MNLFDREDGSCQCGGHAIERVNRGTGEVFWGCSNYPKCRSSVSAQSRQRGDFFLSDDDYALAFYEAFYDGDG